MDLFWFYTVFLQQTTESVIDESWKLVSFQSNLKVDVHIKLSNTKKTE